MQRRILIVDDDADTVESLRMVLDVSGYKNVWGATDADKALDLARDIKPDIALIDIIMPGHDGFYVMDRLQRECPNVQAWALTGRGESGFDRRCLAAGFKVHLLKPIDPDTLVKLLAH